MRRRRGTEHDPERTTYCPDPEERHMRHHDDEPYVIVEKHEGSVGSLLLGVAIGAGLALLFAPRSGQETRAEIRARARRAQDAARDLATGVTDTVVDTYHDARQQVEDRIDAAREAIEIKRQQVVRAMDAGREAAQSARDELERRIAETKAAYQAGTEVVHATPAPRARHTNRRPPLGEPGPTGSDETNVEL